MFQSSAGVWEYRFHRRRYVAEQRQTQVPANRQALDFGAPSTQSIHSQPGMSAKVRGHAGGLHSALPSPEAARKLTLRKWI